MSREYFSLVFQFKYLKIHLVKNQKDLRYKDSPVFCKPDQNEVNLWLK